ncbi:tubulin epsilon and delta complex protein 2 [Latimeria chalumnae]|uniref:tubulin epsilon and delta complex protein 2 n=1 Tax=Latimeria chalumnae TaxID=7897 RepID=UPI00313D3C90
MKAGSCHGDAGRVEQSDAGMRLLRLRAPANGNGATARAALSGAGQPFADKTKGAVGNFGDSRMKGDGAVEDGTKQPKAFTLQDDGSTLRLPPAYKKQYLKNGRLWEKVSLRQETDPAEKVQFVQKMLKTVSFYWENNLL